MKPPSKARGTFPLSLTFEIAPEPELLIIWNSIIEKRWLYLSETEAGVPSEPGYFAVYGLATRKSREPI
jgi:hypothetical protein